MAEMEKAQPKNGCSTRVAFKFEASLDRRPLAIDLVSTLIGHVTAADNSFRHEMVTAFGEAFNNIVIHAYRDQQGGMLEVEVDLGQDEMTIHLMDTGHAVDFGGLNPPDLDSMPERGMGVFMIHALVDEVVYRGGAPNVLSLTKRTANATINEGQGRDELHPHG
jgi:serine/threonine-protein kinase RsbW